MKKEDIVIRIDEDGNIAWQYYPEDDLDEEERQTEYFDACQLAAELIKEAQPDIDYLEVDEIADVNGWRWVSHIERTKMLCSSCGWQKYEHSINRVGGFDHRCARCHGVIATGISTDCQKCNDYLKPPRKLEDLLKHGLEKGGLSHDN